jgi:hypothetical protein
VAGAVAAGVRGELAADAEGSVAAVVPPALLAELTAALGAEDRVAVLMPVRATGLEFDAVVVAEPAGLGAGDLYVALTRATRRLGIVHAQALPDGMDPALLDTAPGRRPEG